MVGRANGHAKISGKTAGIMVHGLITLAHKASLSALP